jgi:hypothetical protein
MTPELTIAITAVVAIALGFYLYVRLVTTLRWRHRTLWESLGKPTVLMLSLDRTVRLQSFIFSGNALKTGDREISSTVIILRVFTLLALVAVVSILVVAARKIVG